jgi:hypothetical protein
LPQSWRLAAFKKLPPCIGTKYHVCPTHCSTPRGSWSGNDWQQQKKRFLMRPYQARKDDSDFAVVLGVLRRLLQRLGHVPRDDVVQ